ncbi:MAG: DEAD/DEAH box helicase [Verrucomicrobiales bacterium]|nr:hypothetical protein [Verrucomicrobiae bacterium]MCP5554664.1 hypothetical protein [Akkermansiaceae bacterium]
MPLPAQAVIRALAFSTTRYLEELKRQRGNEKVYLVHQIAENEVRVTMLEGEMWHQYDGIVNDSPRLSQDSSSILRVEGGEHDVRILKYNRQDGSVCFACRENIRAPSGKFVVSFRWLVKRVLEWIERRGHSVCGLDQLSPRTKVETIVLPEDTSDEQAQAVHGMLQNTLSYVWGPPGTGKSRMVLASGVAKCVEVGETILVLAPTNLAVDHALDAVIERLANPNLVLRLGTPTPQFMQRHPNCCEAEVFQHQVDEATKKIDDAEKEIARHNEASELAVRAARCDIEIESLLDTLKTRKSAIAEQSAKLEALESEYVHAQEILTRNRAEMDRLSGKRSGLGYANTIMHLATFESEHIRLIQEFKELERKKRGMTLFERLTSKHRNIAASLKTCDARRSSVEGTLQSLRLKRDSVKPEHEAIELALSQVAGEVALSRKEAQRVADAIKSARERHGNLVQSVDAKQIELAKLREQQKSMEARLEDFLDEPARSQRISQLQAEIDRHQITIDAFQQDLASKRLLGMTLDGFIGMTLGNGTIKANHVFVDEAAYAPLAKVIPLLSLHCPITLLGDHMQLPPVCQNDNDSVIQSFWAKRSIFLEDAFEVGDNHESLSARTDAMHCLMPRMTLTRSYRFGHRLAHLLDTAVYGEIGLVGLGDTRIVTFDCSPHEVENQRRRTNHQEAEEIVSRVRIWLRHPGTVSETLAVLTPYNDQKALLRIKLNQAIGRHDRLEVLNIHEAQGREWDWVLFSVVDTGNLPLNQPWFTDDSLPRSDALALLNTAFSRARKHLCVFLDATFWSQQMDGRLLERIVEEFSPQN